MSRKRIGLQVILRDEYDRLVEAERKQIMRGISEYSHKVVAVSSLDAAIHFRWSSSSSPVRLTSRDRFPTISNYTPDFLFQFSNGYSVVGEYKPTWSRTSSNAQDLLQLSQYKRLDCKCKSDGDMLLKPTYPHDVMLIVGDGSDENANDAIGESTLPNLGPRSVIVVEARRETQIANGSYVKLTYRRHGRTNGTFASVNAGPPGGEYDLNKWFDIDGGFSARADIEALAQAGECPFVNDTPPEAYYIVRIILPALSSILTNQERDDLATNNTVLAKITQDQIVNYASNIYTRVPQGKLRSWCAAALNQLVLSGIAKSTSIDDVKHYEISLDERLDRLSNEKLSEKLAKGKLFRQYVTIKRMPNSSQYEFDFTQTS